MCWMSLYRGEDAAADALEACREHEAESGGHSWGLAAANNGELVVTKGVGEIPDAALDLIVECDAALGHTRKATRGDVTLENAHPFEVRNRDGEVVAALAHNGTWYDAPVDGRCDSYHIARELEAYLNTCPAKPFREHVRATGLRTGETITVIHRDGRAWTYAGRFTITEAADGSCIRSTGGTPIPQGSVREL